MDRERKAACKAGLDEQIRLKKAAKEKERLQEGAWAIMEAERNSYWKREEEKKIAEAKKKEAFIKEQRERQLREREVIRVREEAVAKEYEENILRGIYSDMVLER